MEITCSSDVSHFGIIISTDPGRRHTGVEIPCGEFQITGHCRSISRCTRVKRLMVKGFSGPSVIRTRQIVFESRYPVIIIVGKYRIVIITCNLLVYKKGSNVGPAENLTLQCSNGKVAGRDSSFPPVWISISPSLHSSPRLPLSLIPA